MSLQNVKISSQRVRDTKSDMRLSNTRSQVRCKPKPELIDLTKHVSNMSIPADEVTEVVPSIISVKRCGGNCVQSSLHCVPVRKRTRRVPVMMVMDQYQHGLHPTLCGHVEVEEHEECTCACPVRPEQCARRGKVFDHKTCRCKCPDVQVITNVLLNIKIITEFVVENV